jgi:polyisoprenoid-binding protein YceI
MKSSTAIRILLEGDLTIHGVTRKVRLAVEGPTTAGKDPWGNTRIGASAIAKINRKDFGLVWNTALVRLKTIAARESVKITTRCSRRDMGAN